MEGGSVRYMEILQLNDSLPVFKGYDHLTRVGIRR